MGTHFLDHLFSPTSVAVFGASERTDAVGNRVFFNLTNEGFGGQVYAINPKYKKVFDQPCYASIKAVKEPVDLAVITTPAKTIPKIIRECGKYGVRTAIIISAGFGETDERGRTLEKSVLQTAKKYNIRLLGPNCLGLIRPAAGLNATFSKNSAKAGQLALISQSGALCASILDWAVTRDIGFSTIISPGAATDVDFGDILDYLAQDSETRSILLYVEGIRDARRFMSGLRIAARMKPVVVLKARRYSEENSRAAITHTTAMVGADEVFDAALQRAGVVRAKSIEQLFAAAQLLATRHRASGNRLAIITNGGGPGVMAADRAIDLGVTLASFSDDTIARLNKSLPPQWSHSNPIDLLGDAPHSRYKVAVKTCLEDPGVDGVLVMLSPQAMTDPLACAQTVVNAHNINDKPILACWMGEQQVDVARQLFARHHIAHFPSPESSVEAFAYLTSHYQNQQQLMQVPGPLLASSEPDIEAVKATIQRVIAENRCVLNIVETRALLKTFSITLAESATTLDSKAVESVHSPGKGRELSISVIRDPVFGPALTFGAGGQQLEVLRDRAVTIPPINRFLAGRMINQTHVAGLSGKFRDLPAIDLDALVQILRSVSDMVCALPEMTRLDINPLLADEKGVAVLDARIVVEASVAGSDRYSHMAIHPYPAHLISEWQLKDGSDIKIRPIRPEDASLEQSFVRELSIESKHFRFMQGLNELTQEMLVRFTQLDYHRELALIAVQQYDELETMLGVARYVTNPDGESCEFALVVADKWHNRGIGSRLMSALMDAARERGLKIMNGEILADNRNMRLLAKRLGFEINSNEEDMSILLAKKQL